MSVPALTPEQLLEAADTVGLSLSDADVQSYPGLMQGYIDANPKGKHGSHSYDLSEYGLSAAGVLTEAKFFRRIKQS